MNKVEFLMSLSKHHERLASSFRKEASLISDDVDQYGPQEDSIDIWKLIPIVDNEVVGIGDMLEDLRETIMGEYNGTRSVNDILSVFYTIYDMISHLAESVKEIDKAIGGDEYTKKYRSKLLNMIHFSEMPNKKYAWMKSELAEFIGEKLSSNLW